MGANYDTSKMNCQGWRRRLGVSIALSLRIVLEFETILQAAFEKLGSTSTRELAQAIGLQGDYRKQRVDRWRDRGSADYEGTIRLLEYVGWLRVDEGAAPASGHEGGGQRVYVGGSRRSDGRGRSSVRGGWPADPRASGGASVAERIVSASWMSASPIACRQALASCGVMCPASFPPPCPEDRPRPSSQRNPQGL